MVILWLMLLLDEVKMNASNDSQLLSNNPQTFRNIIYHAYWLKLFSKISKQSTGYLVLRLFHHVSLSKLVNPISHWGILCPIFVSKINSCQALLK